MIMHSSDTSVRKTRKMDSELYSDDAGSWKWTSGWVPAYNKLFLVLGEKPILIHTLEVFEKDPACNGIILAVKPEERDEIQSMLNDLVLQK